MNKKIIWCPIDLPKCPIVPEIELTTQWHFWMFAKLTENQKTAYDVSFLKKEIVNDFPVLAEWFNLFPFKTIRNIKLNRQTLEVKPHIDFTKPELDRDLFLNNTENEPCGYRVLLKGKRKDKLYVLSNGKKIYCEMPDDTDVYVLGHTSTLHGVECDQDRLTFFLHLEIDPVKHKILLDRSKQKYKSYMIVE